MCFPSYKRSGWQPRSGCGTRVGSALGPLLPGGSGCPLRSCSPAGLPVTTGKSGREARGVWFVKGIQEGSHWYCYTPLLLCGLLSQKVCLPQLMPVGCASHAGLFSSSVVPHITDAIQEWVMRQALIPVDEDGLEPQVCVIEVCWVSVALRGTRACDRVYIFSSLVSHQLLISQLPVKPLTLPRAAWQVRAPSRSCGVAPPSKAILHSRLLLSQHLYTCLVWLVPVRVVWHIFLCLLRKSGDPTFCFQRQECSFLSLFWFHFLCSCFAGPSC